ncbi:hypothetical protein ASO20_01030 [Mycoplasma sp. (ex Biomphalaria glabrata)]|uniref:hypothetical protein n=1 Tax=Mycoplasma sp. (ex Biomphalaria glabrata) TaxID=1749074 RepID=UPI00073AC5B3|nr:hypothetical protein [Mycoplasma sp. (ex Biomphalaria glabrata)]ALV23242.1 hypothetical protein ASO20_01030 [Mycoplasma sp. (ex Biomphalaria glabrata)]
MYTSNPLMSERHNRVNLKLMWVAFLSFFLTLLARFIVGLVYDIADIKLPNHELLFSPFSFSMFAQFTWLTTTMVTFFLAIMLVQHYTNSTNKWLVKLTNKYALLAVAIYDTVVMIAVVIYVSLIGIGVLNQPSGQKMFHDNAWPFDLFNVLVHFVIPWFLIIFTINHLHFYHNFIIEKKFFLWILVYPIIYIIFYIIFALKIGTNIYPVTNLQENDGWQYLPLALLAFELFTLVWYIVAKHIKDWDTDVKQTTPKNTRSKN